MTITRIHTKIQNYIILYANQQGILSVVVEALAPVFENSVTETKLNLKAKTFIHKLCANTGFCRTRFDDNKLIESFQEISRNF